MNPQNEINEIFGCLKNMMEANQDLGIEPPRISPEGLTFPDLETSGIETKPEPRNQPETLEDLKALIGDCHRCKLHKGRNKIVFGEGSPQAGLIIVGEEPDRDEDLAGRPFLGKAGNLLTKIIENGIGINRKDVYICNIVKCHPPENRHPEKDEIKTCIQFLNEQIRIIKPKVICTLGNAASRAMIGMAFNLEKQRGEWFSYMNIPLMPTYHPAYLLKYEENKRQVWNDIKKIIKRFDLGQ